MTNAMRHHKRYGAWHLTGSGWQLLFESDNTADCFRALLRTVPVGADWCVLPAGESPERSRGLRLRRGLREAAVRAVTVSRARDARVAWG
jgi:hypothetical protein